jgi:hypothetical protein
VNRRFGGTCQGRRISQAKNQREWGGKQSSWLAYWLSEKSKECLAAGQWSWQLLLMSQFQSQIDAISCVSIKRTRKSLHMIGPFLAYFPNVGLWDHVAVCVSMNSPPPLKFAFECLNHSLWNLTWVSCVTSGKHWYIWTLQVGIEHRISSMRAVPIQHLTFIYLLILLVEKAQ